MQFDSVANFAKCTVSTGYDAAATTVVLSSGQGAKLPTAPYNLVWWNYTDYPDPSDDPNVEIVRCTARTTDTLTIVRAQEGTSASTKNTGGKTYKMVAGLTALTQSTVQAGANVTTYVVDAGGDGNYSTLEAALAAIGNNPGLIHIKGGTYNVPSGGYGIYSGITIIGEGAGFVHLTANAMTTGPVFFNALGATDITNVYMEGFQIERGSGIATGVYGIDITHMKVGHFSDMEIRDMDIGIYGNGACYYLEFTNIRNRFNNTCLYLQNASNEVHFYGGSWQNANTELIHIDGSNQINFNGIAFEGANQTWTITGSTRNVLFSGCRFEVTGTSPFNIVAGCNQINIIGGLMSGVTFSDAGTLDRILITGFNRLPPVTSNQLRISAMGLIAENFPTYCLGTGSIMITQRVYYLGIGLRAGDVINNVIVFCSTGSTSSTSLFVGLYTAAGTLVATSNDLTTALDGVTGYRSLALNAAYTVPSDGGYYIAILQVSSAMATLYRQNSASGVLDAPNGALKSATAQSSQSTLPSSATFNQAASPLGYWAGLS